MIISARTVVIALLTLIVAITTIISIQTFTNAASAEPQQRQQIQQEQVRLQLATVAANTTNTIGNDSISLSSPASSPPTTRNIRPIHHALRV
jgi:flagellar basal body-associated protein FliL